MATTKRRSEAIWIESKKYWMVKVQKDGERRPFYSGTPGRRGKHEAEGKADTWLESGTEDMFFSAAWAQFLEYQRGHAGTANYKQHEYIGRLYLLPNLEKRRLSKLTPKLWQECIDAAAVEGLSRRTCKNIKMVITAFAAFCDRARWALETPRKGDLTVPSSAPVGERKILQPSALETLMSIGHITRYGKAQPAYYIHAWRFLVLTGLRRGELCGLKNEDISEGVLRVRRSINAQNEETRGKNDNARRDIVLSSIALAVLDAQRAMLKAKAIISPWVFPDEDGACTVPNNLYKVWTTYCRQHSIGCSLHELRHTFISVVRSDMPMPLLKGVVGHSEDMDTDGTYGHAVDGEKKRAAKIVDVAFKRVLKSKSGLKSGLQAKKKKP